LDNSSSSRIINFSGANWLHRVARKRKMRTVTVTIIDVINTLIEQEQPANNVIFFATELLQVNSAVIAEEAYKAFSNKLADLATMEVDEYLAAREMLDAYAAIVEMVDMEDGALDD